MYVPSHLFETNLRKRASIWREHEASLVSVHACESECVIEFMHVFMCMCVCMCVSVVECMRVYICVYVSVCIHTHRFNVCM